MKKHNLRTLKTYKKTANKRPLQMLTCYDYQSAQMLNDTTLDLILVGDSLGNVILGYETTIQVTIEAMSLFSGAVKRGAPDKFVVGDLPFGTYATLEKGIENAIKLFQESKVEAVKLEGAAPLHLELIERLTQTGIPVMGHIGLTPQSVHQLGGYYTHGKDISSAQRLMDAALSLEKAGAFAVVLECVTPEVSKEITSQLSIPTIGIGSGDEVDGQVLVTNDLLQLGAERPPKFCTPVANLHEVKKNLVQKYLNSFEEKSHEGHESLYH